MHLTCQLVVKAQQRDAKDPRAEPAIRQSHRKTGMANGYSALDSMPIIASTIEVSR
jgi:hypothetical protein